MRTPLRFACVAVSGSVLSLAVHASGALSEDAASPLRQLDVALRDITTKVSPAVVQVLVTGRGEIDAASPGQAAEVGWPQRLGSGVIIDPSGYILTNAHVVERAQRVRVVLTNPDRGVDDPPVRGTDESVLPATVVGLTDHFDLALLKVEATDLPILPFADFWRVGEGQVVIAIGGPLGLDDSVTTGTIRSTARQAMPSSPAVFVQIDAPIDPRNSGGALVDLDGRLVGINTFIPSQARGSRESGFAVPAPIVGMVYESLR